MKGGHRRLFGPPVDGRKDRDEDLLLFHEMRRRERERSVNLLQPVSDELESNSGIYPMYRIPSAKKGAGNEFFPLDSDKNDYDWLKTPPATPLFPSLEMEAAGSNLVIQREIPILQPIGHSRFAGSNGWEAPKPNFATKTSNSKSRSVTPRSKPTVTAKPPPATKAISLPNERPTHPAPDTNKKSNFPSISTRPTNPKRAPSIIGPEIANPNNKPNVTDRPRSRGVSPLVRSRIPATLPGFSNETPPNLRTSASSDRSTSASRGRPGNPTAVSDRAVSATRVRPGIQTTDPKPEGGNARGQSCSPSVARGRKPELKREGKVETVNGLVLGSRMVEKVMNARKSGGREEKETRPKFRISGGDGSGFGRLMSKSSLDMALKHMEIKRNSSNFHHYSTTSSGRNSTSTATSSNSSLNLSPRSRTAHEEEFEDTGRVKKLLLY